MYKQDTLLHSLVARAASLSNKIHYCTALWQDLSPVQTIYTIAQPCGKSCLLVKQDTLLHSLVTRAASCTNKIHYCTCTALWQELHHVQTRYTIAQPCGKSCILYKHDTLLHMHSLVARATSRYTVQTRYIHKSCLLYKHSLVARAADLSCTNKIHYCTALCTNKSCLLYKQGYSLLHSLVARAAPVHNKIHYCTALWQELHPVQTR